MLRLLSVSLVIIGVLVTADAQDSIIYPERISLLFAGDIMGHDEQIKSAENPADHTYDYDRVFRFIKPIISEADVAIGNFEVTLAGPPYKGYPRFSSPASLAAGCKNAGFDCLVTANNHAADRGNAGISGTIYRLDSIGMPHTGTFMSPEDKDSLYPMIIHKGDIEIALLNYTYGLNGLKVPGPGIVNILDKNLIISDIEKARQNNPDLVILFVHWGTEYDTIPSESQAELASDFFAHGADMIIGSHPHVMQKMMWFKKDSADKDRIVVYSLGNFISNQRKPKTDGGVMVRIELIRDGDSVVVSDAGYYLTWVYTPIGKDGKKFYILPCSEYENKPEFFPNPAHYQQMKRFINDSRALLNAQNFNMSEIIYPWKP
ncbi:MAG: CapA family protein [Bacteroidales bacterium]|nr:CapA family protein [Bacteroidales bacterium]